MQAVRIHESGSPDVLQIEDIPVPQLTEPEHLLIRIHATAINPVDWKIRKSGRNISFPYILGWDVSGVVAESTSAQFAIGDEIYGMVNFPNEGGGYAEYVITPASHVAPKPRNLTHIEAASVPLAALTAVQAFQLGGLDSTKRILIHAAAGGVGHFAVQIARIYNAREIIGTASTANHEYLSNLGAHKLIDYRQTAFEDLLSDIDIVIQSIGGTHAQRSLKTLRDGGTMVVLVGSTEVESERGINIQPMLVKPSQTDLIQLSEWIESELLVPTIFAEYPLTEVAEAHRVLEEGHVRGKIVLRVVD